MSSRKVLSGLVGAVLRVATCAVALLGVALALGSLTGLNRAWLGREFMLITSGSMSPAISPGDIVLVRAATADDEPVAVGDVITFQRSGSTHPVTHRVTAVRSDGTGTPLWVTKGDANASVDAAAVVPDELVGRVESVLPSGRLLVAMGNVRVAVPVVLAVVLLETALIVRPRSAVETNDPAEEDKEAITQGGNSS